MTLSIQHLARTIAKARHGTDAMWANYMGASVATLGELHRHACDDMMDHKRGADGAATWLRALLAQPDGGQ